MKKSDILAYTPIHFVGSDEATVEFAGPLADRLVRAQTRIQENGYPIKLGLKMTRVARGQWDVVNGVSGWGVSEEGKEAYDLGMRKVRDAGIDCYEDTWASGPTRSMYGVLFDSGLISAGFSAICTGDLDQFPPDENLENFLALHEAVRSRNAVLGVGSRDVPVRLAYNEENGYLRKTFEGVVNGAILETARRYGRTIHTLDENHAPEDPAFKFHGDYVTGLYLSLLSSGDRIHDMFRYTIVELARKRGFFGFEDEYNMVLTAAASGNIECKYFESRPNPFSPVDLDKERTRIIEGQIQKPLKPLKGTNAGAALLEVIDASHTATFRERLSEFYTCEQVDEVLGYMREALI